MFDKLSSLFRKARSFLFKRKDLNLMRTSGFFDETWYLSNNPDVAQTKVDPALHYLRYGGFEGLDPGPDFCSSWYMATYEDVKKARINPLVHYLQHGKQEGRIPHPSFVYGNTVSPNIEAIRRDPIIVHQMGKVGSKTIELSLLKTFETLGIEVPVYHTHALNEFEIGRNLAAREQNQRNPESRLAALAHGERVRMLIDENPDQHWNVITLVRDPIARNIAAFFHNLREYIPDWRERYTVGALNAHEVQEVFLEVASAYDRLALWFDIQIKAIPAFGIDVYATPFPRELGYKIYPGSAQANLLLIRLENLTECAAKAMQEFLGIENFTLYNTNVADVKVYADLYHAFTKLPFPSGYVEKIYKTQLARHFYNEVELDMFKRKWTKNVKTNHNLLESTKRM